MKERNYYVLILKKRTRVVALNVLDFAVSQSVAVLDLDFDQDGADVWALACKCSLRLRRQVPFAKMF
jgi:hypothetical protein